MKPRLHLPNASWFLEMVGQLRHTQLAIITGELTAWIECFKAANQHERLDEFNSDPDSDPYQRFRWDPEQGLYAEVTIWLAL